MEGFISTSYIKGNQPLPILNRINDKKTLYVINYQLNMANATSFAESLEFIVPEKLQKLILIENNLNDYSISRFFHYLTMNDKNSGLTKICIIFNEFGKESIN